MPAGRLVATIYNGTPHPPKPQTPKIKPPSPLLRPVPPLPPLSWGGGVGVLGRGLRPPWNLPPGVSLNNQTEKKRLRENFWFWAPPMAGSPGCLAGKVSRFKVKVLTPLLSTIAIRCPDFSSGWRPPEDLGKILEIFLAKCPVSCPPGGFSRFNI